MSKGRYVGQVILLTSFFFLIPLFSLSQSVHSDDASAHQPLLNTADAFSIAGQVRDSSGTPMSGVTLTAFPTTSTGEVQILKVSADHDLSGLYPIGLGTVINQVTVIVDWGSKEPGAVHFVLNNNMLMEETAAGPSVTRTLYMDKMLQEGSNTLQITAVAADGTLSAARTYQMIGWTADNAWLQPILASLPYIGPDEVEFTIHIPGDPIEMLGEDIWLPGAPTKLGPQATGSLTIPLLGGSYDIGIGVRFERESSTPGRKPWYGRDSLAILGQNDVEVDFTGSAQGNLTNTFPYLARPESLSFDASGSVTFEKSESALVVIQPIQPAGPLIVNGLKAVPPVYDWVKERAELYVQLTPELGGNMTLNWDNEELEPLSANLYAQIEVEGGLAIDLFVAEGKVYLAAGSRLDFIFVPEVGVDKWVFYGKAGYKLNAGWFETSREYEVEWIAYDRSGQMVLPLADILVDPSVEMGLANRDYIAPDYNTFVANELFAKPLEDTPEGTLSSTPLVTNIFPYVEPALALADDDRRLLLWNFDDTNNPIGQGYELQYSLWNGSRWSAPALVTNDTYPDADAEVVWLTSDQALATWERLDDPALPADATLSITQTRKFGVAWSLYDSTNDLWSAPQWLANNNGQSDQTPVLSQSPNGSTWVAWRNNVDGELSGDTTSADRILVAPWQGSSWGTTTIAVSDIPGLHGMDLIHNDSSQAVLAWTTEVTPTGSITPTLQLFSSEFNGAAWSVPTQLTDDSVQHTRPHLVYRQGTPYLVWLTGETLALQSLDSLKTNGPGAAITVTVPAGVQMDQFDLVEDGSENLYATFTAQQGQQRDIYLAYYDLAQNVWGQPVPLTNTPESASYPAAAMDSNQELHIAFSQTTILTRTETTTLPDSTETVTYTVPYDGATDLRTLTHSLRTDLAVTDLTVSDLSPQPGSNVVITATVTNAGDRPLQTVPITFSDGESEFTTKTILGSLVAGQVVTVTTDYTVPALGGIRTLTATADASDAIAELDETNNSQELDAFGPDLVIAQVSLAQSGSNLEVRVTVENQGTTLTSETTLRLYHGTITGTLMLDDTLPALSAGEKITTTLNADLSALLAGEQMLTVAGNATGVDFAEINGSNNSQDFNVFVGPDLVIDQASLLMTPLDQSTVTIAVEVYNSGTSLAAANSLAFYSGLEIQSENLMHIASLPELEVGESAIITTKLNGPLHCGFVLFANPNRFVEEVSWANNLATVAKEDAHCSSSNLSVHLPLILNNTTGAARSITAPSKTATVPTYTTVTDANGNYIFTDLPPGNYTILPEKPGVNFNPATLSMIIPPSANAVNFIASTGKNVPPNTPHSPFPVDGSLEQGLALLLQWSSGDPDEDLVTYDVYLEAENPSPSNLIANDETNTAVSSGPLTKNTLYFWRVVATDSRGAISQGPVWKFTTGDSLPTPEDMLLISAGDFPMGCAPEHNGGYACPTDELPLHTVYLDAYYIDTQEVTNAEYAQCVAAGECDLPNNDYSATRSSYYGNPTYDNYPVIFVDWYDATNYCAWMGKRLPTEAEWEKAARGLSTTAYPWGDTAASCSLSNYTGCVNDTGAVGSYPDGVSSSGALDMAGNVEEWTSDWYVETYYSQLTTWSNPLGPETGTSKVMRGGSWLYGESWLRTAYRRSASPTYAWLDVGFRCAAPEYNNPPTTPYNPIPGDKSIDLIHNLTLSWNGGDPDGDSVTYDVYLEAGNPSPGSLLAFDVIRTSVDVEDLVANTDYYWQVVATDRYGVVNKGPVWHFTTGATNSTQGGMALVPAGEFIMGCDLNHNGGYPCLTQELPLHTVYLDAFYMDIHEVTNGEYAQCVASGACDPPNNVTSYTRDMYYGNPVYDSYPVIWVDWFDATNYCSWVGKRLPTEAEWEKAAQGESTQAYPWGDSAPTCSLSNFYPGPECVGDTRPVGSYLNGASPYGVLDMAGNVAEITNDWYASDYYSSNISWINPTGPASGTTKVFRSGAWIYGEDGIRIAIRYNNAPNFSTYRLGFRCVSSIEN